MGSKLLYYVILVPLSYLPFKVLYFISDALFILIYRFIGYRKKVVFSNLRNSFPDKSEEEIEKIARKFYRHFCDLAVESVKGFSISKKQLSRRLVIENPEVIDEYFKQGKDVIVAGGHYGNWEWCGFAMPIHVQHVCIGIYAPLTDPFFDKKVISNRQRYGLVLCPMKETRQYMSHDYGNPKATFFIADQSPASIKRAHWMQFLNQDTPVYTGTERFSQYFDIPVLFFGLRKVKRGYYTGRFELLTDKPNETPEFDITERLNRRIEQQILEQPEHWLWTHRRWKRKRNVS